MQADTTQVPSIREFQQRLVKKFEEAGFARSATEDEFEKRGAGQCFQYHEGPEDAALLSVSARRDIEFPSINPELGTMNPGISITGSPQGILIHLFEFSTNPPESRIDRVSGANKNYTGEVNIPWGSEDLAAALIDTWLKRKPKPALS